MFNWLDHRFDPGPGRQVVDESRATEAVVSGRRNDEHAGHREGDPYDGVPVFVLTHWVADSPALPNPAHTHENSVGLMRTLHIGLRVADPDRAIAFYTAVGYHVVGQVPDSPAGRLTMLKLPDDELVTVELVHDPGKAGSHHHSNGLSHLVIQVDAMDSFVAALRTRGIDVDEPGSPDGSSDFLTTWITDPDGNRIELVQWPPGHAAGLTAADWA